MKLPSQRRPFAPLIALLRDSVSLTWAVFKVVIPITLAIEALSYFGLTEVLGTVLDPVMEVLGLPGAMGLVVATAMLTQLYAALVVFVSLAGDYPMTVAQTTVLAAVILISHSLPVELRMVQKIGARLLPLLVLRTLGAFAYGWILHQVYSSNDALGGPITIRWAPESSTSGVLGWVEAQAMTLVVMFGVIVALLIAMRLIEWLRIKSLLERLVAPILKVMGIGPSVASIAIIGGLLGVLYGGAMMLQETKNHPLPARDVYGTLVFMCLAHGLIEDTALMLLIGGDLSGILWGRLVFAVALTLILVKSIDLLPKGLFPRLFRPQTDTA